MAFFYDWMRGRWADQRKDYDKDDLKNWEDVLEHAEQDRQRDRIIAWRDRTAEADFAVHSEEPEYYRRTGVFVWRYHDFSGTHKARNHQYLYNLEVYGHKVYTRRAKAELEAAQQAVAARVKTGELGGLTPFD